MTRICLVVFLVGVGRTFAAEDALVRGRVVDGDGKPAHGVEVAEFWTGSRSGEMKAYRSAKTGTDGRYEIAIPGWRLETAKGEVIYADVYIAATGFLHKPVYPDIPGADSFKGKAFHSARWDHSVPYKGNKWGVIGGGASGIQIT